MNHAQYCDYLEVEVERFAHGMETTNEAAPVPSCPGWKARDLSEHLGDVHRWAEHLVRVEARKRIPSEAMGLELSPVDAGWLRRGGTALIATLRASNPDAPMWAWGADQHVRFWSRRQLHETMVHRLDLELASGLTLGRAGGGERRDRRVSSESQRGELLLSQGERDSRTTSNAAIRGD